MCDGNGGVHTLVLAKERRIAAAHGAVEQVLGGRLSAVRRRPTRRQAPVPRLPNVTLLSPCGRAHEAPLAGRHSRHHK